MAKTTLSKLRQKALRDIKFFNQLVKNPAAALKKAGLELPPKDLKRLKALLKKRKQKVEVDLVELIRMSHKMKARRLRPWRLGLWPLPVVRRRLKRRKR